MLPLISVPWNSEHGFSFILGSSQEERHLRQSGWLGNREQHLAPVLLRNAADGVMRPLSRLRLQKIIEGDMSKREDNISNKI